MIRLLAHTTIVLIEEGEVVSFKKDDHEYIHQKGSPGWRSADTEMFPVIGPTVEADYKVNTPKGFGIQDQHGLLRELSYEAVSVSETKAVFKKTYTASMPVANSKMAMGTKEELYWPYNFEFTKEISVQNSQLEIIFTVKGEADMPFMLGYHPAFKIYTEDAQILAGDRKVSIPEVRAVGGRALELANQSEIKLRDTKEIQITTEGFGHFMCWTEVPNMVCIEPISFYPYAVEQTNLHQGFQKVSSEGSVFKVYYQV